MQRNIRKIILILLIFLSFCSISFATEVGEKKKEVNLKSDFTFVINFDEKIIATDFQIQYDPDKIELKNTQDENIEVNNIEKRKRYHCICR